MNAGEIKNKIRLIFQNSGVRRAALFGSAAKGTMKKGSDIDLLVEIEKNKTLFDVINLKLSLEERLGRKVDLVEYDAIKPLMKRSILSEQKLIYET